MADETENLETPNAQVEPGAVNLTEDEKINFFKSFLKDTTYEGDDSLFGDAIKVRFRALTVAESTDVFNQLKLDQQNGELTTDTAYLTALTCYRLGLSLVSINGEPFNPDSTKEKAQSESFVPSIYVKQKAAPLSAWPVYKLSAFAEAFKSFEDKLIALTKAIVDPSFWAAAK